MALMWEGEGSCLQGPVRSAAVPAHRGELSMRQVCRELEQLLITNAFGLSKLLSLNRVLLDMSVPLVPVALQEVW